MSGVTGPPLRGHDPGRTRACNLWFRGPTPYPLGHRAFCPSLRTARDLKPQAWGLKTSGLSIRPDTPTHQPSAAPQPWPHDAINVCSFAKRSKGTHMSLGFELDMRRGFTLRKGRTRKRSYQQGVGPLASCFSLLRPGLVWALPPTELKFAQDGMWPYNSSRARSCVSAVSRNICGMA